MCIKAFCAHTPESDVGMGEEAEQETSCGAWQEGGGQHDVATWSQSPPQRHTAGVHIDGAGRLLHHTLHPAAAVHLHLGHDKEAGRIFFYFSWEIKSVWSHFSP